MFFEPINIQTKQSWLSLCLETQPYIQIVPWPLNFRDELGKYIYFIVTCLLQFWELVIAFIPLTNKMHQAESRGSTQNGRSSLGRILNEPDIVACIPSHYRKAIGKPLVCYKYSVPIGKLWHNTKHYANMSRDQLEHIRDTPCECAMIASCHKIGGHLLTSDPDFLPSDNDSKLARICRLGAKFRPNSAPGVFDCNSRCEISQGLKDAVNLFAMKGDDRTMKGCMGGWKAAVHQCIDSILSDIPDGTPMQHLSSLTYTPSDETIMRRFLVGKVCTSMDKAATTTVFQCQKDYVTKILLDLGSATIYIPCTESAPMIIARHNSFITRFGLSVDPKCQDIPHYRGHPKMHKDPVETRFISASSSSSIKVVSVFFNLLLNALLPGISRLFALVLWSVGITADWTAQSWILKSSADLIPMLRVWNSQYAQHSPTPLTMRALDFQRLYTNININDMRSSIYSIIQNIFALPEHSTKHHVGIKVWQTKPAVWLTQNQMPADDQSHSGTGHGGTFMIFDLPTIKLWLSFLLDNMYVTFGGQLQQQIRGTPMGTNCASNLANFYLSRYELDFLLNVTDMHIISAVDGALPSPDLHCVTLQVTQAFLLTKRYIDDLFSLNNPYMLHLLYTDQHYYHPNLHGIYPRSLLVSVADVGTSVDYMDMTILPAVGHSQRVTTILYDKREHGRLASLFIVKYPHISSNIADSAKYGIITSQFHRYRRIIMLRDNFTFRMAALIDTLRHKGYDPTRMLTMARKLCSRFPEIYGAVPADLSSAIQYSLSYFLAPTRPLDGTP